MRTAKQEAKDRALELLTELLPSMKEGEMKEAIITYISVQEGISVRRIKKNLEEGGD